MYWSAGINSHYTGHHAHTNEERWHWQLSLSILKLLFCVCSKLVKLFSIFTLPEFNNEACRQSQDWFYIFESKVSLLSQSQMCGLLWTWFIPCWNLQNSLYPWCPQPTPPTSIIMRFKWFWVFFNLSGSASFSNVTKVARWTKQTTGQEGVSVDLDGLFRIKMLTPGRSSVPFERLMWLNKVIFYLLS